MEEEDFLRTENYSRRIIESTEVKKSRIDSSPIPVKGFMTERSKLSVFDMMIVDGEEIVSDSDDCPNFSQ